MVALSKLNALFIVALLTFLVGCTDSEVEKAGAFAAKLVGSDDYSVAVNQEAMGSVFELNLPGAQWDARFSDDDILSTCALAFYNQLPNPEEAAYVRLVVEKNGVTRRQTFSDDELQLADRCIDHVTEFFEWHPGKGLDSIRPLVDSHFFPDSSLAKLSGEILVFDSLDNGFTRAEYIGFQSDTIANVAVVKLKLLAIRKQSRQRYEAFVSADSERLVLVVPSEE